MAYLVRCIACKNTRRVDPPPAWAPQPGSTWCDFGPRVEFCKHCGGEMWEVRKDKE